jgi:hypothetical protein
MAGIGSLSVLWIRPTRRRLPKRAIGASAASGARLGVEPESRSGAGVAEERPSPDHAEGPGDGSDSARPRITYELPRDLCAPRPRRIARVE